MDAPDRERQPTPDRERRPTPDRERRPAPVTIEDLQRWSDHGAMWRAFEVTDEHAVIDLCSCTGEAMERVQSDAPELIEFVRAHRAE
jgi:hypothetical protein